MENRRRYNLLNGDTVSVFFPVRKQTMITPPLFAGAQGAGAPPPPSLSTSTSVLPYLYSLPTSTFAFPVVFEAVRAPQGMTGQSFLPSPPLAFCIILWPLRPVNSFTLSSHLFFCRLFFFAPFTVTKKHTLGSSYDVSLEQSRASFGSQCWDVLCEGEEQLLSFS